MKGRYKGLTLVPVDLQGDYDLLLAFKLDLHMITHGSPEGYNPQGYMARMAGRMATYPQGQWLLKSGTTVLGHLGFFMDPETDPIQGYVHMLYIIPEARGQGLGKYMLVKALEHFREKGILQVALKAAPQNAAAMNLYTSLGFVKAKDQDPNKAPLVLMVKKKE